MKATRLLGMVLICSSVIHAGCSVLDYAISTTGTSDDRILLEAGQSTPYMERRRMEEYACRTGLPLRCESIGLKSKCRCERIVR